MHEWQVLPPATRFILQGGSPARVAAGEAFGVPLSENRCCANSVAGRAALWLGPDEHLLLAAAGEAPVISADLAAALAGIPHALVDVSQRQVALRLNGSRVSEILNTGCPLDLDPAVFPPGMCTRTLFNKADIVLWRTGPSEFHLEVWRSFSDYVIRCLQEAGRDFIATADVA